MIDRQISHILCYFPCSLLYRITLYFSTNEEKLQTAEVEIVCGKRKICLTCGLEFKAKDVRPAGTTSNNSNEQINQVCLKQLIIRSLVGLEFIVIDH